MWPNKSALACLNLTIKWLVGWLVGLLWVVLFYSISTLFGSFQAELNFKQFSLVFVYKQFSLVFVYKQFSLVFVYKQFSLVFVYKQFSLVFVYKQFSLVFVYKQFSLVFVYKQFSLVFVYKQFSLVFVYKQLNVKTVPFQAIPFSINTQFTSIWPIDRVLSGATTLEQVDLWAITMVGYSTFLKAPALLKPHHQIV